MHCDEKTFVPDLPVARTRNGNARNDQPWIIAPFDRDAPQLVTPTLRVVVQNEAFVTFTDTQAHRLRDIAPQLMSRGYVEQFWIYGIKAMTGSPALPTPNTQNAYWGWTQ